MMIFHIRAEISKKRIWYSGEEIKTAILKLLIEDIWWQEIPHWLSDRSLRFFSDETSSCSTAAYESAAMKC